MKNRLQPTPTMDLCPCSGCPNESTCSTGFACWDYIDFVVFAVPKNVDRRPSKKIYTDVLNATNGAYRPSLRELINDFVSVI